MRGYTQPLPPPCHPHSHRKTHLSARNYLSSTPGTQAAAKDVTVAHDVYLEISDSCGIGHFSALYPPPLRLHLSSRLGRCGLAARRRARTWGGCGASTPVQNVCAVVKDERLLQTRQTVDSACVDMHIWMGNVAGNKGFTVWAESVQGTRFKKAGASQSLHYRREKRPKNVKCLELLRAVQKAGRRARAGPGFQWRAGLSHQTSKSTATWTGLLKFNDKPCRDHSEEHTWELFKIVLYNIRVLFLTLEKAELGGVWLGAGAAGWGLRRPLCCPDRTACSGPFQKEKPPAQQTHRMITEMHVWFILH